MENEKRINGGINLLRVLSLINIIGGHYYSHGAGFSSNGVLNQIVYYAGVFNSGNVGATVFALITGWFMTESHYSIKKWGRYLGEVWFYSYLVIALAALFKLETFNFQNIVYSIFPVSSALNWYASAFSLAYLFLPFIRKGCILLKNNKRKYDMLIVVGLFVFFAVGTITPVNKNVGTLPWMIYIFALGDYIRWKSTEYKDVVGVFFEKHIGKTLLLSLIGLDLVHVSFDAVSNRSELFNYLESNLFGRYSIFTLWISVCCLVFFSKLRIRSKLLNWFNQGTFGVYLLHDNSVIYPLLWFVFLKTETFADSPIQFLHFFASVLMILVFCSIIDCLRRLTIEKLWIKLLDHLLKILSRWKPFGDMIDEFSRM